MRENDVLNNALNQASSEKYKPEPVAQKHRDMLGVITACACSGKQKSALAVTATLLLKKIINPEQDIRLHQSSLPGSFSGRTLDTKCVTPFLAREGFPSMQAGSGWLTRSFEQKQPFKEDYPGGISPPELKKAFLNIARDVEHGADARSLLICLLHLLLDWRNLNASLTLAKPTGQRIEEIVRIVESHWLSELPGSARLPVLATYAAYKCLIPELSRYKNCRLQDLLSHTSADAKTARVGDIDVLYQDGRPFEAVEVKYKIAITAPLIQQLREKIAASGIKTYYVLSTNELISPDAMNAVTELLLGMRQKYGCQVIVNGVATTIKYYLRLMADTDRYISEYVSLVARDKEIPFDLKRHWNHILD